MNNLTEAEKAYIACAIDCEGHIGIHRKFSKVTYRYQIHLTIGNTNLEFLQWIKNKTKKGKIRPNYKKIKDHKQMYIWQIEVQDIKFVLEPIKQYMIIKRRQAELAIEFVSTIRFSNQHRPLTMDEEILKELIWEEIKLLNKIGDNIKIVEQLPEESLMED